eukprot:jgi/Ulvmu1/9912/UM057_0070.1
MPLSTFRASMELDDEPLPPTVEHINAATAVSRGLSRPERVDSTKQEAIQAALRDHLDTYSAVLVTLNQPALQCNMGSLKEHLRVVNAYKARKVDSGQMMLHDGVCEPDFHLIDTLPFATTWRTEPGCKKAIEIRTRLFYAENGEARPVHDDEVDTEAWRDSLLRHALHDEQWALCAAIKQHSISAAVRRSYLRSSHESFGQPCIAEMH